MPSTRSFDRRGGVLALTLSGIAALSLGTIAVVSFNPSSTGTAGSGAGGAAPATTSRQIQPGEVALVLRLAGITPESMAAAGATGTDCETLFNTGGAYCLQAERAVQFRLAHANLNKAKNKAVHPTAAGPVDQDNHPITIEQAQTALDNLSNDAFTFMASELDSGITAKLVKVKANSHWGVAAPYLTVDRTDQQWLALRGALSSKRFADAHGQQVNETVAGVLSAADATVTTAKSDYEAHIATLKESWHGHEHSVP